MPVVVENQQHFDNHNNNNNNNNDGPAWNNNNTDEALLLFGRQEQKQQLDKILLNETNNNNHNNNNNQNKNKNASSSLICIRGVAGSGKSSFVRTYPWRNDKDDNNNNNSNKSSNNKGGEWLLAMGKFENHRSAEPYSAVIEAIYHLVDQWLPQPLIIRNHNHNDPRSRSPTKAAAQGGECLIKIQKMQELLDTDANILKNIIPKVFDVLNVGKSEDEESKTSRDNDGDDGVVRIPSVFFNSEAVNAAFCLFFSLLLCSSSTKRVVLFLDDIQWADRASCELIHTLLLSFDKSTSSSSSDGRLLIVVSYRAEEVDETHEVSTFLFNGLRADGIPIHTIEIGDLDIHGVNRLVASTIGATDLNDTLALSQVIHHKTAGNPFFVKQFLRFLRDEGFLTYSYTSLKWEWGDIDRLDTMARISDNVAEVVAATMKRLPQATQVALNVASCLGKVVPMDVLVEYFGSRFIALESLGHTNIPIVQTIQREGLDSVFQSAAKGDILLSQNKPTTGGLVYMWSNDKVQQIAYTSMPEAMRASLHIHLGKLLWKTSDKNPNQEWMVFTAADQFNRYSKLVVKGGSCESRGVDVARLNLKAAQLTMQKSALFPAMEMLLAARRNLDGKNRWIDHYDLCLEVFSCLADVGVQIGSTKDALDAIREVEENAVCVEDKFQAHCAMLRHVTSGSSRDYALGAKKTLEILKMYGESFPKKPLPGQLCIETRKIRSKLQKIKSQSQGEGPLDSLLDLPLMTDSRTIKIWKLLVNYLAEFAILSPSHAYLGPLIALRVLNMTCKTGVCDSTAYAVIMLGVSLHSEGRLQEATEYGNLALKLIDKFPVVLGSSHCQVKAAAYTTLLPLTSPLHIALDGMLEVRQIAFRTGDTLRASSALVGYSWTYLCAGLPIGPLQVDVVSYGLEAKRFKLPYTIELLFKAFHQTILNLQKEHNEHDNGDDPTLLNGDVMDQEEELKKVQGLGAKTTQRDINVLRLMLACVFNKWDTAEGLIDALESYLPFDFFYQRGRMRSAFIGLASFAVSREQRQRKYRALGKKALAMFRAEVQKGSVNGYPILKMLEAEESPSKERYEEAIKACARVGLMQYEAYMCERAGIYFLSDDDGRNKKHHHRDPEWAKIYLERALFKYNDWGATGKVTSMLQDVQYKEILNSISVSNLNSSHNTGLKGKSRFVEHDAGILEGPEWSSTVVAKSENFGTSSAMEKRVV